MRASPRTTEAQREVSEGGSLEGVRQKAWIDMGEAAVEAERISWRPSRPEAPMRRTVGEDIVEGGSGVGVRELVVGGGGG